MNILRDLGFGLRQIVRRPVFSLVIVFTLAVGIGPNVAIFSVLHALVIEPLPYFESERLVQIWQTDIDIRSQQPLTYPDFLDLREKAESLEAFGIQSPHAFNLGGDEPERVLGVAVTADALSLWGISPAHGRLFTAREVEGEQRLVVLSDRLWKRRYGSDLGILDRSIPIDGGFYQVVGIMPPDFEYYTAWTEGQEVELWTPFVQPEWAGRASHWLLGVARLKPGVGPRQAEAELRGIAAALQKEYPETNARTQVWVKPFLMQVVGGMGAQFLILITAVGFVLITACANVASMLLARAADRKTEVAVRGCLGAGRRRILTQLLTESGLLSIIGGAAGLVLAVWSLGMIKSIIPPEVPRVHGIEINTGVMVFALLLTVATATLFGLSPALIAARTQISSTLREGSGTVTATKARNGMLRLLIVGQLAIAFLLTNGAILLYTSYENVLNIPFDFDTRNVLTARISLDGERYEDNEQKGVFWRRLIERLESLPGVERAAVASKLPLRGGTNTTILVEGQEHDHRLRRRLVEQSWVDPNYFEAMGIELLAGRVFGADEGSRQDRVIVVNQALVDRYFSGKDPLGQVITPNSADPEWRSTIVGVVASVPQWGATYPPLPETYASFYVFPMDDSHLVVRSAESPSSLIPALQAATNEIDADLPLSEPKTMQQLLAEVTRGRQFLLTLVSLFAVLAMILAMAGIFGTMSHNVAQRTREMGVRIAFGAYRRRILAMVLREGLVLDIVGMGLGCFMLFSFAVILRSQLYGIGPVNLLYIVIAAVSLSAVTLVATVLPALRASRISPMRALRNE